MRKFARKQKLRLNKKKFELKLRDPNVFQKKSIYLFLVKKMI